MRISEREKNTIVSLVKEKDPSAKIYLYGSRIKEDLAGGDIDLLVISEKLAFKDKIDLLVDLKQQLGDQKIDLSIKSARDAKEDPFFQSIQKKEL
jgi:predicted nucleotidyltransferase